MEEVGNPTENLDNFNQTPSAIIKSKYHFHQSGVTPSPKGTPLLDNCIKNSAFNAITSICNICGLKINGNKIESHQIICSINDKSTPVLINNFETIKVI
jgi:hypothetical protein